MAECAINGNATSPASCTTVAMEATGVYWIPLYQILEDRGLEVCLVNARHAKNVPGRKTDVRDAEWIAQLLEHGLLRRAYADLLTDGLRVEILAACGYEVTVVEFVGSEHTAKNILLRAHRRHPYAPVDRDRWRLAPVAGRCAALGVSPDLLRRLA